MSIESQLRSFILNNFLFTTDQSALDSAASLTRTGVIDSTGMLELIMHLEETYGIKVRDDEMIPENLDSVVSLAAFVGRKNGR